MNNKYIKRAHISERKFRSLLHAFAEDIPALTASQLFQVNPLTSQRIFTLVRQRVSELAEEETKQFVGDVEVDENSFGPRRVQVKCGRGAAGKIPVVGLHKRGDCVYVSIVERCHSGFTTLKDMSHRHLLANDNKNLSNFVLLIVDWSLG